MENLNTAPSNTPSNNKLEIALNLLSKGFCVIPNQPAGKTPLIGWQEYQARLSMESELKEWFTQWPDANIGIVTGAVSKLVVIDIDGPEGQKVADSLKLPKTVTATTGRVDGKHLYFIHPGTKVPTKASIASKIDIRGDGGQVVAPGSVHSNGTVYAWAPGLSPEDISMAELPANVMELFSGPSKRQESSSNWTRKAFEEMHEGNRNDTFFRVASRLHRMGLREEDILNVLVPQAEIHDFPYEELEGLVKSACSYKTTASPFPNLNKQETETGIPFESVTLEGLLGESSDTEIEWIVQDIFPKESVSILAGPAGHGKSFLLLDLAIEVSRGGKWLDCFPTTPGAVLYIDEESARSLIRTRLRKLCAGKEMASPPTNIHLVLQKGLHLDDPQSKNQLIASIEKFRPSLIVMDSLIRVHGADENSATEMSKVFSVVRSIANHFGCAIVFADHQRKANGYPVSPEQLLRGSTDKSASVDTLLCLQRSDGNLIIDHAKSRFAEAVRSFVARIEDDETKKKTIVKHVGDAESIKHKVRLSAARTFLEQYFGSNRTEWIPRRTIVEAGQEQELSEKMIDGALQELRDEGLIERKDEKSNIGKGGKQAYYRLKGSSDTRKTTVPTPSPSSLIYTEETETTSNGIHESQVAQKSLITDQIVGYSPQSESNDKVGPGGLDASSRGTVS